MTSFAPLIISEVGMLTWFMFFFPQMSQEAAAAASYSAPQFSISRQHVATLSIEREHAGTLSVARKHVGTLEVER